MEYALENGIPLIIWLGESEMQEGVIKVRSLSKHEEYIIKRDQLQQEIHSIIALNPVLLPQDQQVAGQV